MRVLVLYDSEFGNTRELALTIADELKLLGSVQIAAVQTMTEAESPSALDLLVVGGPTQVHGASPSVRQMLDAIPTKAFEGVLVAAFDTRLHGPHWLTGAASIVIAKQLAKKGGRLVVPPESFLVTGREGPLAEGELERSRLWSRALAQVATAKRQPAATA